MSYYTYKYMDLNKDKMTLHSKNSLGILLSFLFLTLFSCDGNAQKSKAMKKSDHHFEIKKTDQEWKAELDDLEYQVLREKGTERAFTGEFNTHKENGVYTCAGCGNPVFKSTHKYDSGSGWPSFTEPYSDEAVIVEIDKSHGMIREEIICAKCGGHLGHKFPDGPKDKGGERYCINSVSMDFEKKPE